MADHEMADQEMADQEMADQEIGDTEMEDLGSELEGQEMEDQDGRHLWAVDLYFITDEEPLEHESPLLPEYLELAYPQQNLWMNMV